MQEKKTKQKKGSDKLVLAILIVILISVSCVFYLRRSRINIENTAVRHYMKSAVIDNGGLVRKDVPEGYPVFLIRSATIQVSNDPHFRSSRVITGKAGLNYIENLVPGRTYYYRAVYGSKPSVTHKFKTSGQIRMLSVEGIHNVRDIGGWKTANDQKIRYGYIFRGSEMDGIHSVNISANGILQLQSEGIRTEIDLRSSEELENARYPLKDTADYNNYMITSYMGITGEHKLYRDALSNIITSVLEDKPVYVHCWGGADRTGTVIALIEGSLGVSKEDVIKDYELTSFSVTGIRKYGTGTEGTEFKKLIEYIEREYDGATFGDKCRNLLTDLGINKETLDDFSRKMLED